MPDYLEQFRGMNSATLIFRPCLAIFSAVPVDAVMVTRQITRNRPAPDPIHVAPDEPHLFFLPPSAGNLWPYFPSSRLMVLSSRPKQEGIPRSNSPLGYCSPMGYHFEKLIVNWLH